MLVTSIEWLQVQTLGSSSPLSFPLLLPFEGLDMAANRLDAIKGHIPLLLQVVDFDALRPLLLERHVVNRGILADIQRTSGPDEEARNRTLIVNLVQRTDTLYALIDVLKLMDNNQAVDLLTDSPSDTLSDTTTFPSDFGELLNTARKLTITERSESLSSGYMSGDPEASSSGDASQDATEDHTDGHGSQAEPNEYLYTIKATLNLMEGPGIYTMTSKPRGYCLIVNNVDFQGRKPYRHGSEEEEVYLIEVFRQLGFKVIVYRNQSSSKMIQVFEDLSKDPELKNHDAFVGFILTHGERDILCGSDDCFVKVEDILCNFNNYLCPELVHKPKLFFIQACRGNKYDYGVIDPYTVSDAVASHTVSYDFKQRLIPTWTDTVICYSTIEGFVSLRNERTGSWFGDALCRTLIEHACDLELHHLLTKVNEKVMEREGEDRIKQSLEVVYRGWKKLFYFNPGVYNA